MENGSKLYSGEIKNEFLKQYSDESQHTYSHVFKKSAELENLFMRDLHSFETHQLEHFLKQFDFSTLWAAKTYVSVISSYTTWAIENGHKDNDKNPAKSLTDIEIEKFVIDAKTIWTEDEIEKLENSLVNFQDKVIIRLIFEGVQGHEASELLNLKREHVDFTNRILLLNCDKSGEREIEVSERAIGFIQKALDEKEYYIKNGEATGKRTKYNLVENDYVLRVSDEKDTLYSTRANKHLIYRRIQMISSFSGYDYLNVKNIVKSGQLLLIAKLYKELKIDTLEAEHLRLVAGKFNLSTVEAVSGNHFYNLTPLRKLRSKDFVQEFYPDNDE